MVIMIDPNDYPDAKCSVCHIPYALAIELTRTDDGRFLCEQCILTDNNGETLRAKLARAYEKLEAKQKDEEKRKQFWD
jgi:hypothetical protein